MSALGGPVAVSWSGGKDSMLALDRAVRDGIDVRWLLNLYDGQSRRVRFHGVRTELIGLQAERLGIELVQKATTPADFEPVFVDALGALVDAGAQGIVFGNIHLADVRAWYEERTVTAGLHHVEPLWGEAPAALVAEVLRRGYRACVTSVDLLRGSRAWAGRELDSDLAIEIAAKPDTDPAGEHGEFHTYVFDGPLFGAPIDIVVGAPHEADGHLLIDLTSAVPSGIDAAAQPDAQ
jgi:uncharacterized protein (TIGR00290 family)